VVVIHNSTAHEVRDDSYVMEAFTTSFRHLEQAIIISRSSVGQNAHRCPTLLTITFKGEDAELESKEWYDYMIGVNRLGEHDDCLYA
jgi:hypothetical protein